uniref:Uncharacterized protein n=1 Tax=Nicotiana tabacum TaxID=4097 RepID=A0A1S3XED9_TOBAC|nr:PREDICTED: uncharacterized protein LOC107764316 [Nicotiana tabacum]
MKKLNEVLKLENDEQKKLLEKLLKEIAQLKTKVDADRSFGKEEAGSFFTGTCKRDAYEGELLEQSETCNAIVLLWIMNNIAPEPLGGVVYASDEHLVWENLRERFNKVNHPKVEVKWCGSGGGSAVMVDAGGGADFGRGLKEMGLGFVERRWAISDSGGETAVAGLAERRKKRERKKKWERDHAEHLHQQRSMQFLSGLNDSYDQARRQILMKTTTSSLNQAYAMIIQDEIQQTFGANMITDKAEPLAMQAGKGKRRKQLL